jgi:hypothetical protein
MSTLVDKKFREWTSGLGTHDSVISIFQKIRDIPYSLAMPMSDPGTAQEQILAVGKGSCGPKHYLLAEMFRRLGFEVVYATVPFLWNDPDLSYPPGLRKLATGLPVAHHLACRVLISSRWVLVDATWDPPLKRAGFPVNEHWDGRADTLCAVKPWRSAVRTAISRTLTNEPYLDGRETEITSLDRELDHRDTDDRARYVDKKSAMHTMEEIEQTRQFHQEFDRWLQEIRGHR